MLDSIDHVLTIAKLLPCSATICLCSGLLVPVQAVALSLDLQTTEEVEHFGKAQLKACKKEESHYLTSSTVYWMIFLKVLSVEFYDI